MYCPSLCLNQILACNSLQNFEERCAIILQSNLIYDFHLIGKIDENFHRVA